MSSLPKISLYETTKQFVPVYWTYCGIGLLAFIANLFIVFIYLSSSQLRSRFTLFIGLAIVEGINGAAFLLSGIQRLWMEDSFRTMYSYPKTMRSDCAMQIENTLLVIGNQGPAMLALALGFERFCAIRFPASYRHFKEKMFHILLIFAAIICITSVCVALYTGLIIEKDLAASLPCTLSNAFGFTYTTFNYFFTSFGHTAGFIFNFAAFWIIQSFKNKGRNSQVIAKEIEQIRLMHFISICSLIMVVIPNMFLYATRFNFFTLDYVILGWLNCAFVSRSAFSLHLLGFRSPKFRQRVSELLGCTKNATNTLRLDFIRSASIPQPQQQQQESRRSRRPTETSQITVF